MRDDGLTSIVIAEAIRLHREVGPGLFETVYEVVLAGRLNARGIKAQRQFPVPITIDDHYFDAGFKIDILVEDKLVLEIKSIERLGAAHAMQVLTYLRMLKQPVGLLLNFSATTMKEGIRRVLNDHCQA